jgi:AcrR family transcriptional regulator
MDGFHFSLVLLRKNISERNIPFCLDYNTILALKGQPVMKTPSTPSNRTRRTAQATINDDRILDAARSVFLRNPNAPISAVAAEAGMGISALYLRYKSKEQLLRKLCQDGLRRYIAETEAALADPREIWLVYSDFMRRIVDADTHSLVLRLAGTFRPTKELRLQAASSQELTIELFSRVKATGSIRPDIEVVDIALIFEQLAAIQTGDQPKTAQLRHRYLALILDSLRNPAASPLPGPPPSWEDINSRW